MQRSIAGEIAWVTGAGSGIGQAGALALAQAGAKVVLSGRRVEALEETANTISAQGGSATIVPADIGKSADVTAAAERIKREFGRCDILLNSAGLNIRKRAWRELDVESIDTVIDADLSGAFYVSAAVLPMMREQNGGLLIHIGSWAGRYVSPLSGPVYTAAKTGMLAMSESINHEECVNGIRSCCICPQETATAILDKRPVPITPEEKARMLQVGDLAETILFVARMPASVCLNEILISPTWNRGYVAALKGR
jgi:NADP-dependent 3-hydroxy acid dehydrogenase YdfG